MSQSVDLISALSTSHQPFFLTLKEVAQTYFSSNCRQHIPETEEDHHDSLLKIISNWRYKYNTKSGQPELFHHEDIFPVTFAQYLRWVKFEQQRLYSGSANHNENLENDSNNEVFSVRKEISNRMFGQSSASSAAASAATFANVVLAVIEESGCDKITTGSGKRSSAASTAPLHFRYSYSSTRSDPSMAYSYSRAAANDNDRDGSSFHQCFPFDTKAQHAIAVLGLNLFAEIANICEKMTGKSTIGSSGQVEHVNIDEVVEIWRASKTADGLPNQDNTTFRKAISQSAFFNTGLSDVSRFFDLQATTRSVIQLVERLWCMVETHTKYAPNIQSIAPYCSNPWLVFAPNTYDAESNTFLLKEFRDKILEWIGLPHYGAKEAVDVVLSLVTIRDTVEEHKLSEGRAVLHHDFLKHCFASALEPPPDTVIQKIAPCVGTGSGEDVDGGLGFFPYVHLFQRQLSSNSVKVITTQSVLKDFASQICREMDDVDSDYALDLTSSLFAICGPPMVHIATSASAGSLRQFYIPQRFVDLLSSHASSSSSSQEHWVSVRSILLIMAWDLPTKEPLLDVYDDHFHVSDEPLETSLNRNVYIDLILVSGPIATEHIEYIHNFHCRHDRKTLNSGAYGGVILFATVGASFLTRIGDTFGMVPNASGKCMTLRLPNGATKRFPTIINGTAQTVINSKGPRKEDLLNYYGGNSIAILSLPNLQVDGNANVGLDEIDAAAATMVGKVRKMHEAFTVKIMPLSLSALEPRKQQDKISYFSLHTTVIVSTTLGPSLGLFESTFWSAMARLSKLFALFYQFEETKRQTALSPHQDHLLVLQYTGAGSSEGSLGISTATALHIATLDDIYQVLCTTFVKTDRSHHQHHHQNVTLYHNRIVETLAACEALRNTLTSFVEMSLKDSYVPYVTIAETLGKQDRSLSNKTSLEIAQERMRKSRVAISESHTTIFQKAQNFAKINTITTTSQFHNQLCVAPPLFHGIANYITFRKNEGTSDSNDLFDELTELPPSIYIADGNTSDWEISSLSLPQVAVSGQQPTPMEALVDELLDSSMALSSLNSASSLGQGFGASGVVRSAIDLASNIGQAVVVGASDTMRL